ncbi:ankyrin repeat domain-containing protein [Bradyrhizobium genosp. P]|uniref:ankyrin repeat domain-containing protein n=1 Tax=Bradyrhizobium genosp. P TaxID=83641 RepID=UPI003CE6945B
MNRHDDALSSAMPEEDVLYRRIGLVALLVVGSIHSSLAAQDPARCRELIRKYETGKAQFTAIEVSLTLFAAADADCTNLATELLDQGASVDARDRLGARPLSHAARSGHLDMVDLLLARGAPIDARNLAGSTALYFAAERGQAAIVQRLIDRGADVNLTGQSGASPVAAAAYGGRDMVMRMLLAHGADGRKADDTGKPPVIYAAAGGQLGIVKQLLALDIDVNARYANDLTLLMWASGPDEAVPEAQAIEVVSYLLDAGAKIDDRDARGRTALMIAAEGNHPAIVKALLSHGADPALTDKAGKHAADLTVLSALREELIGRAQSPAR